MKQLMNRIAAIGLVLLSLATSASAQIWSNGNIVTHVGVGNGGNDIAAFNVDPLTTTFGLQASFNASGLAPAYLADDYTPIVNELVRGIRIPWYVTNNVNPSIDRVYVRIYEGSPLAGGQLIYDSGGTGAIISSGNYINQTGRFVYRTSGFTGVAATNSQRRLQATEVGIDPPVEILAGVQYFFAWSFDSPSGTSVFTPSLARRGNGEQLLTLNGSPTWGKALGTGTNPNSGVDLPFELNLGEGGTSPYNIFPEAVETIQGIDLNSPMQNIMVSDDQKMLWLSDSTTQVCEVQVSSTATDFFMRECRFGVEVGAGRPGLAVEVQLLDFLNGIWDVWGFVVPPSDTELQARVFQNASNFIGPNRQVRSRVRWQPINDDDPSQDGWYLSIDWCRWRIVR